MVMYEDYSIAYSFYLANKEFEESTIVSELSALNEAVDKAKIKEALDNFIKKIIAGIQNAWNKFKENVSNTKMKFKAEDIDKAIANKDPDIAIENYIPYNLETLDSITVQELNYDSMKDSLTDNKTFLQKYYSSFFTDPDKSVYDNMKNKISGSKVSKYNITKDDLNRMYDYCKNHIDSINKLESSLKAINSSTKNVDNAVNNILNSSTNESYNYFTEADGDNKIVDDKPETNDANGEGKSDDTKDIQKAVRTFFSASSEILSAQMKLRREIYFFYASIVNKHTSDYLKDNKQNANKTEENKEAKPEANTAGNQINI